MLTERDYLRIAAVLRFQRPDIEAPERAYWLRLVWAMADGLAVEDPQLDTAWFVSACGA